MRTNRAPESAATEMVAALLQNDWDKVALYEMPDEVQATGMSREELSRFTGALLDGYLSADGITSVTWKEPDLNRKPTDAFQAGMDRRIRASLKFKRAYIVTLTRADTGGSIELNIVVRRDSGGQWRSSPLATLYTLWHRRDTTPHDRLVRMLGILKSANLQSVAITGGFAIRQERIQAYLDGKIKEDEVFDFTSR